MNTILLIEDNVNNIMLLEDIFVLDDISSARLVSVETGEEALNRAIELQPVLILMDLRLPGIDGLETTQILKHHPLTKDIPGLGHHRLRHERGRGAGAGRPAAAVHHQTRAHPWSWPTGSAPFWATWNDSRCWHEPADNLECGRRQPRRAVRRVGRPSGSPFTSGHSELREGQLLREVVVDQELLGQFDAASHLGKHLGPMHRLGQKSICPKGEHFASDARGRVHGQYDDGDVLCPRIVFELSEDDNCPRRWAFSDRAGSDRVAPVTPSK